MAYRLVAINVMIIFIIAKSADFGCQLSHQKLANCRTKNWPTVAPILPKSLVSNVLKHYLCEK